MMLKSRRRDGTHMVEFALVGPIVFGIVFGFVLGTRGIFIYQEMSWLAREGARYASVRGDDYAADTDQAAVTEANVRTYLRSRVSLVDSTTLTCTVTWNSDNVRTNVTFSNGVTTTKDNTVTVTCSHVWTPGIFFGGSRTLTSTTILPMSY